MRKSSQINHSHALLLNRSCNRFIRRNYTEDGVASASRIELIWLCFLILSFFYELPIREITSYDRINPRLFDVATLLGMILIFPQIDMSGIMPRPFIWWRAIVYWFTFCALIWSIIWLPWHEAGRFSLLYAARYLQGLFVVYLAIHIQLSSRQKRILHYTIVVGGIFLTLYAIPEYMHGGSIRQIADGKTIYLAPGTILGPLGSIYSHIAILSSLAFAMSLALLASNSIRWRQWSLLGVALFVAWPALVCGSRSGLLMSGLILACALLFIPALRSKTVFGVGATLFVGILVFQLPILRNSRKLSFSVDRLLSTEESKTTNTIIDRIGIGTDSIQGYTPDIYRWQGIRLPIIGGGFYAVPIIRKGIFYYRIGYGIHNGYLFSLEQGGIVAFVLCIGFCIICFKSLRRIMRSIVTEDASFALGAWLFYLAMLVEMWYGGPIWQGEGTVNLSTCLVLILMLACRATNNWYWIRRESPPFFRTHASR